MGVRAEDDQRARGRGRARAAVRYLVITPMHAVAVDVHEQPCVT